MVPDLLIGCCWPHGIQCGENGFISTGGTAFNMLDSDVGTLEWGLDDRTGELWRSLDGSPPPYVLPHLLLDTGVVSLEALCISVELITRTRKECTWVDRVCHWRGGIRHSVKRGSANDALERKAYE